MALLGGSREAASLPASPSALRPLPSTLCPLPPPVVSCPLSSFPPTAGNGILSPWGTPPPQQAHLGCEGPTPPRHQGCGGGRQMVGHGIAPPGLVGV